MAEFAPQGAKLLDYLNLEPESMLVILRAAVKFLNSLISPIDRLFYCRGLDKSYPPVFIVGSPRSGTTLVYQLITQQFRLAYFTSLMNYFYGIPNIIYRLFGAKMKRPEPVFESTYGKIPGKFAPSENANFWFRWFPDDGSRGHYASSERISTDTAMEIRKIVNSVSGIMEEPMVFKSVYLSLAIPALVKIFPDARFVFVRRNPVYVCQSLLRGRLARPDPRQWWSVKVPGYKDLLGLPLWQQVVHQVMMTNKILEKDLEKHAKGKFITAQYESICKDPQNFLHELDGLFKNRVFTQYADKRFPKCFGISENIYLADKELENIKNELTKFNG